MLLWLLGRTWSISGNSSLAPVFWNDPGAQGEGVVTAPTGIPDPKTSTAGRLTTEDLDSPAEEKHLRPRARNPHVYDPDWVNP